MLYEVLKHIRNFFPDLDHQLEGSFKVEGGTIDPSPVLLTNQYVLIEGSVLNDGIWNENNLDEMQDEEFTGRIVPLKIPKDLIALAEEIENYNATNKPSGYVSESFGGYSYTKPTKNGMLMSWQDAFKTRLNAWRKL